MKQAFKYFVVAFLGALLVACGGGGGGGSNPPASSGGGGDSGGGSGSTLTETLTISASLGRITDATVKIYAADYEQVIGEGALDENGKAQITVTYSQLEPAIVEVTAGANSSYFDEAAGEVALAEGSKLHAMTTDPASTAVTPLTELAWQLALNKGSFPLDAERVELMNDAVSKLFSGGLRSITYAPEILAEMPAPNSQTIGLDDLYAALLGAFAKVGSAEGSPALAVLEDLSQDVADGVLNDNFFTPEDVNYVYEDFGAELRAELESWIATYGNDAAQEAIFVMPLPGNTIDYRANIPVRDRILDMEYGVSSEIAYSRDGGSEWSLFPAGEVVSYHREGTVIGIAAGDTGADPDAGEFIDGWSVDMATASYEVDFDDPSINGVRVEIPTGDPLIKRQIVFVTRDGLDMDDMILIETDLSGPNKLAHVLAYETLDFMEPGVETFFNDVQAMADNGDSLTVVKSGVASRVCTEAFIGTNNANRYPKLVGVIHDDDSDTESLEPQRMRYAEAGAQREILFENDTLFRINDNTDRVDFISMPNGGAITQWATNDSDLIAEYCP